jgi:3-oxoadipate enol-lactonase
MSERVIDTNGATIRVTERGAGEPALLFLHYWGGSSRTWQGVIDRLAGKARCIALDQRGWGGSMRPMGDTISLQWRTTSRPLRKD